MKKIALIGFMGSGKSSVAQALAPLVNLPIYETDALVLQKSGRESIMQIFELEGEPRFRDLEREVCQDLSSQISEGIISCGGGLVGNPECISMLKHGGTKIFQLQAKFDTIAQRLKGDTIRPHFRDLEKAKLLYEQRQPIFESAADFIVVTDHREVNEIAGVIADLIKKG